MPRPPEQASVRLCSVCELGILTLTDCDQAPFEGPAIVIPPALPEDTYFPKGYTGWIRVEFEVQGALRLSMEAGEYILKIPASGVLRTSSAEQYGWAKDHYYYYSAEGMRRIPDSGGDPLIWGRIDGEASGAAGKRKYEEFFVGTAQQFKESAARKN